MRKHLILMTVAATLLTSCGGIKTTTAEAEKFDYTVERAIISYFRDVFCDIH